MAGRIHLLDPDTVNRIAAGEVVERPASVVKELIENGLDAGARSIAVEVGEAGKRLISVTDDGCGMSEDDGLLALERHATSKIHGADDLLSIRTLGFRGEALPSIASVSRLTLITRTAGTEEGVKLQVEGGKRAAAVPTAAPVGTMVRVEDLFHNTPARRKFLKSDATELAQIVDLMARYAMIYPEVTFVLRHEGQEVLRSPGGTGMLKGIAAVWGREVAEALVPVDHERNGIVVTGYVSPPHVTRHSRAYQYTFVNRRPVRSRTLGAALTEAYRSLTPERRFPIAVLGLRADPAKIDCNVHPSKTEVKFERESDAFEAVRGAIKAALLSEGMMPEAAATPPRVFLRRPGPSQTRAAIEAQAPVTAPEQVAVDLEEPRERARFPFSYLLDGLRIVGQAMNTFIIAETSSGLAVIDQHVAHERVIYERLCGIKGKVEVERQALLSPETLNLDRRAAIAVEQRLEEIRGVGFDLEPFGNQAFLLRAVPAVLAGRDYRGVLQDILDELSEEGAGKSPAEAREKVWTTTACRMAVKAGDPLSHAEMLKLVHDLADTENPYLCPHGRPITVTLSTDELMRRFKRS
jgi:DNA mismatch repair protein MutL